MVFPLVTYYHLFIHLFMPSQTLIKQQLYARDFAGCWVGYRITRGEQIRVVKSLNFGIRTLVSFASSGLCDLEQVT